MTCNPIKVNFVKSYDDLVGKPSINGITLKGNVSFNDLGLDSFLESWFEEATRDFVTNSLTTNSLTTTKITSGSTGQLEISSDDEIQISGKSVFISTVKDLEVLCTDGSDWTYEWTIGPYAWNVLRMLSDTYLADYNIFYFPFDVWSPYGFICGDPTSGCSSAYMSDGMIYLSDVQSGSTVFYASNDVFFATLTYGGTCDISANSGSVNISADNGVTITNVDSLTVQASGADGNYQWTITPEEWNKLHELVLNNT